MTGDSIDFAVVYVVPIAWATWRVSRGAGVAVSAVSAVVAIAVDLRPAVVPVVWKAVVEIALFGVCVAAVDRIRGAVVAERRLVDRLKDAYDRIDREVASVADLQRMLLPSWTPTI